MNPIAKYFVITRHCPDGKGKIVPCWLLWGEKHKIQWRGKDKRVMDTDGPVAVRVLIPDEQSEDMKKMLKRTYERIE